MSIRTDGVIHTLDDAFAGAAGLWTPETCHSCGKAFNRTADWVYSATRTSHHKTKGHNKTYWFCSYGCMRAYQKGLEEEKRERRSRDLMHACGETMGASGAGNGGEG